MHEDITNLFLYDFLHVVAVDAVIFWQEASHPCGMLLNLLVGSDVLAFYDVVLEQLQLFFEAGRQNCQSHNLDEADIFFLDIVILGMWMIDTQWMFFGGDVVAQGQIEFIGVSYLAGNRCDGIVWLAVGLCKDESSFIGITTPCFQYMGSQVDEALLILMADTQYGEWPFHDAGFHVFVTWDDNMLFNRSLGHGEGVMSALEVIMAQDGATDDRKVGIGAQEVVWEKLYKVKELNESISLDFHWSVLTVKNDAVLVVIYIWRILQAPFAVVDGDWDDAVVLSCRMVYAACVAFVLHAEQTFRIRAGFSQLGCCDGFWIFFRFGEVDGDINLAEVTVHGPFLVFLYTIATNIVAVLA